MALFQKLQRTVCKLTRPVVQKANTTELALSEEDEETCDYAVALQTTNQTNQTNQTTDQTNNETTEEQILFLIKHNPRITQAQIADEMDVPKSTVKYYVSKLSKAKIIKREGTVHNGKWIIL